MPRHAVSAAAAFLAFAALFLVSAAAGAPDHIRTVSIISAIGSDVTMQPGSIFASSDDTHLLQTDWNIDDLVTQQIASLLTNYTIVSVPYDAQAFRDAHPRPFVTIWGVFSDMIAALPRSNGVDAYVLVAPNYDAPPGVNIALERSSSLSLASPSTFLSVQFVIGVYTPDGKRLDWGTGKYPGSGTLTGMVLPARVCPFSFWADTPSDLTEAQRSAIRNEITYLLGRGIPYALASANLISSSEAQAADAQASGSDACRNL